MYQLTPKKVYMLDRVKDNPVWLARMERILKAIDVARDEVICVDDDNLPEIVEELESYRPPGILADGQIASYMRSLFFTTMDLREGPERPDLSPLLEKCYEGASISSLQKIFGYMILAEDQHPHGRDRKNNVVCWPTYNFGTMQGCPHGCVYCAQDGLISIALNLEEYMEEVVGPTIDKYPWNKVFRMILASADLMAFEPEYGLFDLFTRKLAQYDDRYGHFHTAGANVDWLADLPHRDRLVGVWSTTCDAVARHIEPGSAPAIERIKAGRKCQDMGIPVRYKFKPMIPIRNWREEYAEIIEQALTLSTPESIGFCVIMWMNYDDLLQKIDPDLLDQDFLEAARGAKEEMKDVRTGPFPHQVRAEIYHYLINEARRWDKDVLLYISTESREMWDELKDELGQNPAAYICGCSSVAVPGRKLALSPGLRYSTYRDSPV